MYAKNLNHVYAIHFVCLVIRTTSGINLMWGNFLTFTNPVASPELTAWIFSSVPSHFISGKSFSPFLPLKNEVSGSLTNAILVLNFWGYSISISIANCYFTFNCYTYTTLPRSRMAVLLDTPEQFDAGLARESDQGNDALEGDPFGTTPLSGRRLWRVLWLDNEAGLVTLSGSLRLERHENVTFATRG